jgi:hypothetical protein
MRVRKRAAPSKIELTFNAETIALDNNTCLFYDKLNQPNRDFIRKHVRHLNESGLKLTKLQRIAEADRLRTEENCAREASLAIKRAPYNAVIDAWNPKLDLKFWRGAAGDRSRVKIEQIDPKLRWHKRRNKPAVEAGVKILIGGTKAVKLVAHSAASKAWNNLDPPCPFPVTYKPFN